MPGVAKWKRQLTEMAHKEGLGVAMFASGKHLRLDLWRAANPRQTRRIFCALTPSDARAVLNIRTHLRHAARDLGVTTDEQTL